MLLHHGLAEWVILPAGLNPAGQARKCSYLSCPIDSMVKRLDNIIVMTTWSKKRKSRLDKYEGMRCCC